MRATDDRESRSLRAGSRPRAKSRGPLIETSEWSAISGIPEASGNLFTGTDKRPSDQGVVDQSSMFPEKIEKVGGAASRYFSVYLTGGVSRPPRRIAAGGKIRGDQRRAYAGEALGTKAGRNGWQLPYMHRLARNGLRFRRGSDIGQSSRGRAFFRLVLMRVMSLMRIGQKCRWNRGSRRFLRRTGDGEVMSRIREASRNARRDAGKTQWNQEVAGWSWTFRENIPFV